MLSGAAVCKMGAVVAERAKPVEDTPLKDSRLWELSFSTKQRETNTWFVVLITLSYSQPWPVILNY